MSNQFEADDTEHLCTLLTMIFRDDNFSYGTGCCISGVIDNNHDQSYINITPNGSSIIMPDRGSVNIHPLTRVIFWTVMLKLNPGFGSLFSSYHQNKLQSDLTQAGLLRNNFNSAYYAYNYMVDVVRNLKLDIYASDDDNEFRRLAFHLICIAVFRNGWNGTSTKGCVQLYYGGSMKEIKFSSEDILSFNNVEYPCDCVKGTFQSFLEKMVNNEAQISQPM